jgi:branched-chain amino acid transport system ATP-binding protein
MTPLLELRNVNKTFSGLRAVANVSFEMARNNIVALIGPNGAGKTTLFNMIAGAVTPDSGTIHFNGICIDGLRADQVCRVGIGRTFQIVQPFAGLSVLDNVVVGALRHDGKLREARINAETILDTLGLSAQRELAASHLTLPERKRLEVARALATRPKLLLLDEVLAGLRPTECDQMVKVLQAIHQRDGIGILLIEHVMRAVMALAQQVVVLHHGEVIAQGAPDEISRNPAVLESYLGADSEL